MSTLRFKAPAAREAPEDRMGFNIGALFRHSKVWPVGARVTIRAATGLNDVISNGVRQEGGDRRSPTQDRPEMLPSSAIWLPDVA